MFSIVFIFLFDMLLVSDIAEYLNNFYFFMLGGNMNNKIRFPALVINFKTYEKATGEHASELAKICDEVSKKYDVEIIVAVQDPDVYRVSHDVENIKVLGEHFDAVSYGSHTGFVLAEDLKDNGAVGSILNHSEHRLQLDVIENSIKIARSVGLVSLVCANSSESAESIAVFNPDIIAIEPPELIGGDISVSSAEPSIITDTVRRVRKVSDIPILCGAGIKSYDDVYKSLELGADGVLVASAVTKSDNPLSVVENFAKAISDFKNKK